MRPDRYVIPCLVLVALLLPSCVMRRTVKQDHKATKKSYVVKRPLKHFINNVEVE